MGRFTVSIPDDLEAELRRRADEVDLPVSQVLASILREAFGQPPGPGPAPPAPELEELRRQLEEVQRQLRELASRPPEDLAARHYVGLLAGRLEGLRRATGHILGHITPVIPAVNFPVDTPPPPWGPLAD
jgi:hypothetical protein